MGRACPPSNRSYDQPNSRAGSRSSTHPRGRQQRRDSTRRTRGTPRGTWGRERPDHWRTRRGQSRLRTIHPRAQAIDRRTGSRRSIARGFRTCCSSHNCSDTSTAASAAPTGTSPACWSGCLAGRSSSTKSAPSVRGCRLSCFASRDWRPAHRRRPHPEPPGCQADCLDDNGPVGARGRRIVPG